MPAVHIRPDYVNIIDPVNIIDTREHASHAQVLCA